ncbi:thiosulfate sulfurtransferase/rhodanese-like domain-containing protein 3 isoform X2 [Lycorma delicatula]
MSSCACGKDVDYNQLIKLMSCDKVTVIDVREQDELKETGKIPGSLNIPLGEISKALNIMNDEEFKCTYGLSRPSVEDTLIFSCRSGKRSLMALDEALKLGYKNSLNFAGGWMEWEKNISPK